MTDLEKSRVLLASLDHYIFCQHRSLGPAELMVIAETQHSLHLHIEHLAKEESLQAAAAAEARKVAAPRRARMSGVSSSMAIAMRHVRLTGIGDSISALSENGTENGKKKGKRAAKESKV
jgi:hypothetical protein